MGNNPRHAAAAPSVAETRARIRYALSDAGVSLDAAHAIIDHYAAATGDPIWSELSHAVHELTRHGVHGGTVKSWAQAHHGQDVRVIQATPDGSAWTPPARNLDASRSTFATFAGSRRDYAHARIIVQDRRAVAFLDVADLDRPTLVVWIAA